MKEVRRGEEGVLLTSDQVASHEQVTNEYNSNYPRYCSYAIMHGVQAAASHTT